MLPALHTFASCSTLTGLALHARGRRRRPASGTGRTPSGRMCTSTARETRRACTPTRPPSSAARLEPCLHNATHTRPLPLFPFPFPTCHTHWRFPRSLSVFLRCFCWALLLPAGLLFRTTFRMPFSSFCTSSPARHIDLGPSSASLG
uniref:Putative ca2/+/calmodulin-dependent protein kinase n=1 Tax=Ixodes scapularis TaxID=6945 RepID=A0A4D5RDF6_IXOSC